MSYNALPTVATGDSWSAAQHNTYIKDNLAELWPYVASGDLAYANAANTLARLPISSVGGMMYSTGGAPAWLAKPTVDSLLRHTGGSVAPSWIPSNNHRGALHAQAYDDMLSEFTTNNTSGVDISGLTLNINTSVTCTIVMFIQGAIATAGGSSIASSTILGVIGGVVQTLDTSVPQAYYAQYMPWFSFYRRTGVPSGTINCKAQLRVSDSSRTAYIAGAAIYVQAFAE